MKCNVAILMATYNGETYLKEQLDSILSQSFENYKLFIRDDGSTDGSKDIIRDYQEKDKRIVIVPKKDSKKGQLYNFSELLESGRDFSYIFFSDQDDCWNNDKIEISLKKLKEVENKSEEPILLYTNYNNFLTDTGVKNKYFSDNWKKDSKNLFVQNWVMGCTMVINNSLLRLSLKIPKEAENHDNWIANLAAACGKIYYINNITMNHRIHNNNVTTQSNHGDFFVKIKFLMYYIKHKKDELARRKKVIDKLNERVMIENNYFRINEGFIKYNKLLTKKGISAIREGRKNEFCGVTKMQTFLFYLLFL